MRLPIDLRSDSVTRPTPAMLAAMQAAPIGDDVFGEDPSVNALEATAAALFGKEKALFCASGTMTNQIAIKLHTQPGEEVVCDRLAHVYNYEGGGIAFHSGASVRLLHGERGMFTAEEVAANINPDDIYYPRTALVCVENTVNKGGGCCYPPAQIEAIGAVCRAAGLPLHLDGARIFHALAVTGQSPAEAAGPFDTVSVCLSKGLGAPVGSLLLGSRAQMAKARRLRKVMGGGWRQAGSLAAAGSHALAHHVARLPDDHRRAATLAETVQALPFVTDMLPVETNLVIFSLVSPAAVQRLLDYLATHQVLATAFGPTQIRLVTHLDFDDEQLNYVVDILRRARV